MNARFIIPVIFILLVALSPFALAGIYYEIPASTVNQTYVLDLTIPTWIKITLKDLVANATMDNIALSFRDSATNEILIIYIKTSGYIHLQSIYYNIPDTQLGQWQNGAEIYIKFDTDKITVYLGDPLTTNISYSFNASGYNIYDVRVHSNDDTHSAYTAGTIILQETTVVEPIDVSDTITPLISVIIPLIIAIISIAIPFMFMKQILKILNKIF